MNVYDLLRRIAPGDREAIELIDYLEATAALGTVASRSLSTVHRHEPEIIQQQIGVPHWINTARGYVPETRPIKVCKTCREPMP